MWIEDNNQLIRDFTFKNFIEAFAFMTKIALLAEKMDHHPSWKNTYNQVKISLTTHEEGNIITKKDRLLASQIDEIYDSKN